MTDPRVFWPGDEIPAGVYVIGSDARVVVSDWPTTVDPDQPKPLVEVAVPDYHETVEAAAKRGGKLVGVHPKSGRWGVLPKPA